MLETGEGEATASGDDQVHHRPAEAETAGLAGEAADHLSPPLDLAQGAFEQVGGAQLGRLAEVDAERRQILRQGSRGARVVGLQLAHQP